MALLKRDPKPAPPTAMEIKQAVEKNVLPLATWRPIVDAEHDAAVAALAEIVGKKTAAQPSMQRRLGILRDGSAFVLALEIVAEEIIGQPWFPSPNGPPQYIVAGFLLPVGVELLQGALGVEAELTDRRRRYSEYLKAQAAKAAAEAKAIVDKQAAQAKEEQERAACHAGEWALLNSLERFACRLALAVESRDAALAADLRTLVAQSLAGADDSAESWPRTPGCCTGLALEALSAERRQALALEVVGERENRQIEQIPKDKLPSLRLMAGNDRAAVIGHWAQFSRAVRRGASGRAA